MQDRLEAREREYREWTVAQAERDRKWREEDLEKDRIRYEKEKQSAADAMKRERYKTWTVAVWTFAASCITWLLALAALSLSK